MNTQTPLCMHSHSWRTVKVTDCLSAVGDGLAMTVQGYARFSLVPTLELSWPVHRWAKEMQHHSCHQKHFSVSNDFNSFTAAANKLMMLHFVSTNVYMKGYDGLPFPRFFVEKRCNVVNDPQRFVSEYYRYLKNSVREIQSSSYQYGCISFHGTCNILNSIIG